MVRRFANFFTDTEFTEEDIEESVAAIGAEFDRAVGIDLERRDRVEASLTNSDHPYHQFDIGKWFPSFLYINCDPTHAGPGLH